MPGAVREPRRPIPRPRHPAGPHLLRPAVASALESRPGTARAHLPSHGDDARADREEARRELLPRDPDPAEGLGPGQALTAPCANDDPALQRATGSRYGREVPSTREGSMSGPIVCISHNAVKDGKLEGFREAFGEVADALEAEKPGTIVYLAFADEDGSRVSVVHVFPDAGAMAAPPGRRERMAKASGSSRPRVRDLRHAQRARPRGDARLRPGGERSSPRAARLRRRLRAPRWAGAGADRVPLGPRGERRHLRDGGGRPRGHARHREHGDDRATVLVARRDPHGRRVLCLGPRDPVPDRRPRCRTHRARARGRRRVLTSVVTGRLADRNRVELDPRPLRRRRRRGNAVPAGRARARRRPVVVAGRLAHRVLRGGGWQHRHLLGVERRLGRDETDRRLRAPSTRRAGRPTASGSHSSPNATGTRTSS